jgi:hypothetical protein
MAKAEQKTLPTKVTVENSLNTIEDETKREDCFEAFRNDGESFQKRNPLCGDLQSSAWAAIIINMPSGHEGDSMPYRIFSA